MDKFIRKSLPATVCFICLWISATALADVRVVTDTRDSVQAAGVTSWLGDQYDSGLLSTPQVESINSLGSSQAIANAEKRLGSLSVKISGSIRYLAASAYIKEILYFINESADSSTEVKIPYEVEWSHSGEVGPVHNKSLSFAVGKRSSAEDALGKPIRSVSFGPGSSGVHHGNIILQGSSGMISLDMNVRVGRHNLEKLSILDQGHLVFRFPEGIPEGVTFDSLSGHFLGGSTDKSVWVAKNGGIFEDWSPFENGGLFNDFKSWIPARLPNETSHLIFKPDPYAEYAASQGLAANPVTMPSSSILVDSVTVDSNHVKLIFPETFSSTSLFSIKNKFNLSGGYLELSAEKKGLPIVGTYGQLKLLGDAEMLDSKLIVGARTAVSGFNSGELEVGHNVVLQGAESNLVDRQLATFEAATRLLPWGDTDPVNENGVPQLEVKGQGRVLGNLTNEGWLKLDETLNAYDAAHASRLVVEGDYTQADTGVLDVTLGGVDGFKGLTTALTVKGKAVINGALRLNRKEGYIAKPGDYFTIVLAGGGIDLGGGLTSSGRPIVETISQLGFKSVEGILDTGDPNVFWGIDYNQRRAGKHIIEVIALSVPRRAIGTFRNSSGKLAAVQESLNPAAIQNHISSNLIITSHGTAHYSDLNGMDSLGEIAIGMYALAEKRGLDNEYDFISVDWRQFATNALGVLATPECLGRNVSDGVRSFVSSEGHDSRARSFDPYETARFSQQYARSLLAYFKEAGYDIGGLQSLQTIGHSSGAFMADGIFDVLMQPDVSPFEGNQPTKTHLTLLDAYLPPAKGGENCAFTSWVGEALGGLGVVPFDSSANQMEHYFNRDIAKSTNNNKEYRPPAVVAFDVTDYLLKPRRLGSGHSVPIEFYRDSIYAHLNEPLLLDVVQPYNSQLKPIKPLEVLNEFGAAFSPLFFDLGIGHNLDATFQKASLSELSDGDIDVIVSRPNITQLERWGTGSVSVEIFDTSDTDVISLGNSTYRFSTNSPAIGHFELQIDRQFNLLMFDVERVSGIGGTITALVDGIVVGFIDLNLEPDLYNSGKVASYQFSTPIMSVGGAAVEFVVNDTEEGRVVVDLSKMGFAILENVVDDENINTDESNIVSPSLTAENSGGGVLSSFLVLLLFAMAILRISKQIRHDKLQLRYCKSGLLIGEVPHLRSRKKYVRN